MERFRTGHRYGPQFSAGYLAWVRGLPRESKVNSKLILICEGFTRATVVPTHGLFTERIEACFYNDCVLHSAATQGRSAEYYETNLFLYTYSCICPRNLHCNSRVPGPVQLSPLKEPPLFLTAFFRTVGHFVQSTVWSLSAFPPTLPNPTLSAPSSNDDNSHDDHFLSFNPSLA